MTTEAADAPVTTRTDMSEVQTTEAADSSRQPAAQKPTREKWHKKTIRAVGHGLQRAGEVAGKVKDYLSDENTRARYHKARERHYTKEMLKTEKKQQDVAPWRVLRHASLKLHMHRMERKAVSQMSQAGSEADMGEMVQRKRSPEEIRARIKQRAVERAGGAPKAAKA